MHYRHIAKEARFDALWSILQNLIKDGVHKDQLRSWMYKEAAYIQTNIPDNLRSAYIWEYLMLDEVRPFIRAKLGELKHLNLGRLIEELQTTEVDNKVTIRYEDLLSELTERFLVEVSMYIDETN